VRFLRALQPGSIEMWKKAREEKDGLTLDRKVQLWKN
jgi:hypothetical protein